MSVCQCGRSIGIGLLCWYGTVHERGGQSWMSWRACAHCHRECQCLSLSCSFIYVASCVRSNGQGGAIYAESSARIDIEHSSFVGNSAVCLNHTFGCLSCALCHSLTLQKVLRSRLVIGWCRQLASCVLSLAKRGSYGSGALPALVALMSVCV